MRSKKPLIIICMIFFCGLLLISFNSNDISSNISNQSTIKLDFLVIPDQLIVYNEELVKELQELNEGAKLNIDAMNEKYDDLTKMSEADFRIQEKMATETRKKLQDGKVINNTDTIEVIFNQLSNIEGNYVEYLEVEEIIALFHLNDDKETPFYANVDKSYYRYMYLLKGGYIIIPRIIQESDESRMKTRYIKAKLSDKSQYELERLFK